MKKTLLYTITGLIPPAMTLLLLPVYLHYLSTSDYVILALTNSFLAVFSIFFNLKTDQAYRTLYFHESENTTKQQALFQTLFSFHWIALLFWLFIFYFLGDWVFGWVFRNNFSFFPNAWILLATFLVGNVCNLYYIQLQNTGKVKSYSLYISATTVAVHGAQLLMIVVLQLGFFWFLLSALMVNVIVFLVIVSLNRSLFALSFSKPLLIEALKFSLPFIPFLILYQIENQLDRFFMERYLSVDELAAYAVLISITTAVITFFNSVDNAIRPELYRDLSTKSSAAAVFVREKLDLYLMIGLLAFSFLLAFGTHIHWFLQHEKYNNIRQFFPWITLAFFPIIGIRFWALQLVFDKQVGQINQFLSVKIILLILLFLILIPTYKIFGAIVTIGISNIANAFVFFKLTKRKVFPSPKIILFTILFVSLNCVLLLLKQANFLSLIAVSQFLLLGWLFLSHYRNRFKNIVQS
jgi:O-antigen/teichoic acid export membrane protein